MSLACTSPWLDLKRWTFCNETVRACQRGFCDASSRPKAKSLQWSDFRREGHEGYARMAEGDAGKTHGRPGRFLLALCTDGQARLWQTVPPRTRSSPSGLTRGLYTGCAFR